MPEKPKSTAPDGESPEKPTMIDHPAPDGESPGTELGTKPEIRDGGERLTRIITEFGRLATGRLSYESKTGNSQTPESSKLPEQPKPPADERQRLRAALREVGKLNPTKSEPKPSTREDVLAALRGATTGANKPVPRSQAREEVLAALRGEYSSPAVEKANSGSDSSVADTESESVAPENQEEPGSSDEQDPNESLEVSDKQSPSGSEALKRLAEADTTQLTIRNMAGVAKDLVRVLKTANTLRAPVLFGRIQESTSGILAMLNRFNGAVEEVGGDLPRGEKPRLGDAIDQVRYALAVINNVAEQGFSRRISDEEYSQHALQLNNSITELQRFMNVLVERQENNEQG